MPKRQSLKDDLDRQPVWYALRLLVLGFIAGCCSLMAIAQWVGKPMVLLGRTTVAVTTNTVEISTTITQAVEIADLHSSQLWRQAMVERVNLGRDRLLDEVSERSRSLLFFYTLKTAENSSSRGANLEHPSEIDAARRKVERSIFSRAQELVLQVQTQRPSSVAIRLRTPELDAWIPLTEEEHWDVSKMAKDSLWGNAAKEFADFCRTDFRAGNTNKVSGTNVVATLIAQP